MTRLASCLLLTLLTLLACGGGGHKPSTPDFDVEVDSQPHATASARPAESAPQPTAAAPGAPTPAPDAAPAPTVAAPPPYVANPATITKLEWPATTTSFVLRRDAHAYPEPDLKTEPLGKIIGGTRLPVGEAVDGDKHCKVWLAAAPRGWLCARHAKPSDKPPLAAVLPVVPEGWLVPQDYYSIDKGAARYRTEDDVRAGIALPEPKEKSTYMVTKDEKNTVDIDGVDYVKTSVGLVAATDLSRFHPSKFTGIDLVATPPPSWPFAWVYADDRKSVTARATADKKGAAAGTFPHRAIVPVLEESGGFVRVADGQWIDRKNVRVAHTRPRPVVADAHTKWIDLDRDEQVMIAYDGDTPVFATLFSSGRRKADTPPAIYRIRSKSSLTKMTAEEREDSHYEVSEVPWATRFRSGLYFHAAYWHDRFGKANSHGCVNLSPIDAKWVYDWTEPVMPAGWNELEVPVDGSMVVRVYDAKKPDPPVFDYEKEAKERAKIRKREKQLKEARLAAEAAAAEAAAAPAPAPVAP
ncbi:MAG TPA: L,D-transpeptidase [Kofleriaceae bacterium]|nr:L,D-transpeptidase [Kofleriaceae bacterium]